MPPGGPIWKTHTTYGRPDFMPSLKKREVVKAGYCEQARRTFISAATHTPEPAACVLMETVVTTIGAFKIRIGGLIIL